MLLQITNSYGMNDLIENYLDLRLASIYPALKSGNESVCDYGEYCIAVGFTVIQQYITSSYRELGIGRKTALNLAPQFKKDITIVATLNAGANYWKHSEEWHASGGNFGTLKSGAKETIATIEKVTPLCEYTCSNLLAELLENPRLEDVKLSSLFPLIDEWRNNLEEFYVRSQERS